MADSKRQLLAIMFTDIVGYSAMMNDDEAKTVDILKINLEIHTRITEANNGKVRKEIGDGLMLSFKSVSAAIEAAKQILSEVNKNGYQVRIGIHEGEVIVEKGDLFGDNVNIASRIESNCKPGCIYISESARANLRNKKHIKLIPIGRKELKNIKDPMDLYEVCLDSGDTMSSKSLIPGYAGPLKLGSAKTYLIALVLLILASLFYVFVIQKGAVQQVASKIKKDRIENSIAVLPFESSSNEEQYASMGENFADDIIVKLCKLKGCKVISPRSSFSDQHKGKDIYEIAKDLKVNYVLEGSFNVFGNNVKVNYKLINIKNAEVAVADSYSSVLDQIFQLRDQISGSIVNALDETLIHSLANDKSSDQFNHERYLEYHRGKKLLRSLHLYHPNKKQLTQEARAHFIRSTEIDPDFYEGYIEICESFNLEVGWGYTSFINIEDSFNYYLKKAALLKPESSEIFYMEAQGHYLKWEIKEAERDIRKSIEINENNPQAYFPYALFKAVQKDKEEFIINVEKAIQLDPMNRWYTMLRDLYLATLGEYQLAIQNEQEELLKNPDDFQVPWVIGTTYVLMGAYEKAQVELEKRESYKNSNWMNGYLYAKTGQSEMAETVLNTLLEIDEKGFVPPTQIALVYLGMGNEDKAFEYLEKAVEIKDGFYGFITCTSLFDPVRDQFKEHNLPTFLDNQ